MTSACCLHVLLIFPFANTPQADKLMFKIVDLVKFQPQYHRGQAEALPVSLSLPPEAAVEGPLSWHSGLHRTHTDTGMGRGGGVREAGGRVGKEKEIKKYKIKGRGY